jgi:Leucine-rich repeat (LRR) protein
MLCYNKIREIKNFLPVVSFVLPEFEQLQWLDLSHNYLEKLDYNFKEFKHLKALYLHCNFLYDLNDFMQLA